MMVLPSTWVVYGIRESTFTTRRVRPFASAASTRIDAAGAHVDAARCERERGVRQIERDARGLVDGERQGLGRRTVQVQLQLHLLTRQRLNVDGLELERLGGARR